MSDNTSSTHKLRALLHSSSGVSTLDLYTLARLASEDEGEQAIKGNQNVNKLDESSIAHQEGPNSALDPEGAGRADVLGFEGLHRDGSDLRLPHGDALSTDAAASTTPLHPMLPNLNVTSIMAKLPAIWNIGETSTTSAFAHAIDALPLQYTPSWSPSPVASHSSVAASTASETRVTTESASVVEGRNDDRSHEQQSAPFNDKVHLSGGFAQDANSGSNNAVDIRPIGSRELTFSDINTGRYSSSLANDSVRGLEKTSTAASVPMSGVQANEASSERVGFAFAPYQGGSLPNLDSHRGATGPAFAPVNVPITKVGKADASPLTGEGQVSSPTVLAKSPQPAPALPTPLDVPVTLEDGHQPNAAMSGSEAQPDTVVPAHLSHPTEPGHPDEAAPAQPIAAAPSPLDPALPAQPEAVASAFPAPAMPVQPDAVSLAPLLVAAVPLQPGPALPVQPEAAAPVPLAPVTPVQPSAVSPAPLPIAAAPSPLDPALPAQPEAAASASPTPAMPVQPGAISPAPLPVAAVPSPPGPALPIQPEAVAPASPAPAIPVHPGAVSPAPLPSALPEHPGEAAPAQPVAAVPSPSGPALPAQPDAVASAQPVPAMPTHPSESAISDVSHPVTPASPASPESASHGGSVLPVVPLDASPSSGAVSSVPSTHQTPLDAVVKASPAASPGEPVKVELGTDLDRAVGPELPASKIIAEPASPPTGNPLMHQDVEYASHDEMAYGPTGPGILPEFARQFMAELAATPPQADIVSQASLHHEQDTLHALTTDATQVDGSFVNKVLLIDVHGTHNDAVNFDDVREIGGESLHGMSGS